MPYWLERILVWTYNRFRRRTARRFPGDLLLGSVLQSDLRARGPAILRRKQRAEHIAILGKTGTGKTTLLRSFCEQDIRDRGGFVFFDLHGQVTDLLLSRIAQINRARGDGYSRPVVLLDPADRAWSVGLNVLDSNDAQNRFVKVAELVEVLRARWHLEAFGARTEELLRNTLLVLMDCRLTLLEIEPLLTDSAFRRDCLRRIRDGPEKAYFEVRFEALSPQMRAVVVEPVLNKVTAFSSDPHIRHIVGQATSTLDLRAALEEHHQIIVNLDKGRLGQQAFTLGSLILAQLKAALFGRKSTRVFTIYCDEIQNLVAYDQGLESLLAEARKFGVSIVSANQYLEQLTPAMRAAVLSCGTQLLFQLSGSDSERLASSLGEPQTRADDLRHLPKRQFLARVGSESPRRIQAPDVSEARSSIVGLKKRIARRRGRTREDVELEITRRLQRPRKELDDWD